MSVSQLSLPPLALYIHIPWCIKKCPYCDFNSHAVRDEIPEKKYIERLLTDLKNDLPYAQNRELESIFIGGGTPSLFSPASIGHLLAETEKLIPFSPAIEITMEANPGTFEFEKFQGFRAAGVNRLSIGIQSFNNKHLKALGRVHDAGEADNAAANIRSAGFDNFNLDLMFGLPEQSIEDAMADIKKALSFEPPHLSWYQLTIEPNTVFYSQPPAVPEDDQLSDMQDQGMQLLSAHNLKRYEISAFCQPGQYARHNINYWQFGDYLGIGAGAHGKLTLIDEQQIIRTQKTRLPASYLEPSKNMLGKLSDVKAEELPLEFMMNALRLCNGTNEDLFTQRCGLSIDTIAASLEKLRSAGLLQGNCLATTDKGFMFLNDVLAEFLPEGTGGRESKEGKENKQDKDRIPLLSK